MDGARRLDRPPWQRAIVGAGMAASTAILLTLSFPPYGLWPLVFVGLVPMIVAQHRVIPKDFAGLANGVGVGGFFAGYFGLMFQEGPWFMRVLPLFIAVIAALVGTRERAFHGQTGYRWFVLHGPTVWVAIEMIRGLVPVFGTWGFAAYALFDQPWLIQPVSIFGVYGLSLLILVVNYALGLRALALVDSRWQMPSEPGVVKPARANGWLLAVAIGLTAWSGLSGVLLGDPAPDVRVATIQPAFQIRTEEGIRELAALTHWAADRGAELVVWHEGALPFDPQVKYTDELRELARVTEAHLVIGYIASTRAGSRNEAVILTPEGRFLGPFGKDHPVAWSGETSITRGAHQAYETELGVLGMIICYDLDFTDTSRRVARAGAQLIAVPSFDWPAIATKHYTHLVFRAVENRVAAIKADVAFDSAIVDPYGRLLERSVTPTAERRVLLTDVPLGWGDSPVLRLGDWVGWLCLAGTVAFLLLDVSAERSQRRTD